MNAVAVQYFDQRGGFCGISYLEKADLKLALVPPVVGRTVRVPVAPDEGGEQAKSFPPKAARRPELAPSPACEHTGNRGQWLTADSHCEVRLIPARSSMELQVLGSGDAFGSGGALQ
jgi:hypothetical protein